MKTRNFALWFNFFRKDSGKILILCLILFSAGAYLFIAGEDKAKPPEMEGEGEGIPSVMKAMDLWSEMRTYPFKKMDASAFTASFEQARAMRIEQTKERSGMLSITTAPWSALGPMNFSGRVLCLGFHPTNPNIMWVGSASGGLWKTTTGGTGGAGGINWQYVPTGFPVLGVASIAVHPTDGNTLYVGTGEVYNNAAAASGPTGAGHIRTFRGSYGIGILKTTDGGTTWTKTLDFSYSNLKGVADMAIDPSNPSIVYAATTDGLYRTTNAGTSWSLVPSVPIMAMELCYKPGNSAVLYVGCGDFNTAGAGIYKSTNANIGGTPTFTKLTAGLPSTISGKIQLAISPISTSKVYASIGADPNVITDPEGLWVSTDDGANWSQPGATNIIGNQGWYAHDIAADPTNANLIYWGELDLYKSTNGGTSNFTKRSTWSNWNVNNTTIGTLNEGVSSDYVHADIHRIYSTAANTFFMCTDGGIFKSTDAGVTFVALNGGLMTSQIYSNLSVSKSNPNFMVGGLQDNEGFIYNGSAGCKRIGSLGDGFHAAINPRNDDTCYVASYYLNLKRSYNKAVSFPSNPINLGNPPTETVCFNAPYVVCPSDPNIMYAGTYRVKKSTDRGATWSNMSGALSTASTPLIYIAPAPTNANIVYFSVTPAGGTRSKLFKTINGGTSFTEITGTLPDRYYSDIDVDPTDPNRVIVTLSGFGSSHLYMSNNGGTSWSDLGTGLPDVPHNTVMFNPNIRSNVYVGNDLGVFYAAKVPTGALGATTNLIWVPYSEGLEDAAMISDILVTNTNKLRLGTYGRGLWERDLAVVSGLPVIWKDFDAWSTEKGNQLRWIVTAQNKVNRYEIEYGVDGIHFNRIADAPAKNGGVDITYDYLHRIENIMDGFYRIKMVDMDGSVEYSSVKTVKAGNAGPKLFAYPNPTTGLFKIKMPTANSGSLNVRVYDNSGKLVMQKKWVLQPGMNEFPIDISRFAAGNYQVVCENDLTKWRTKILKK